MTEKTTFERNMENADRVSKEQRETKDREATRDKSHDGRVSVGKDVSLGASKDGVNIKKTF